MDGGWVERRGSLRSGRCLRAAARPVGGGYAQTAGNRHCADRRVSQVETGAASGRCTAGESVSESSGAGRAEGSGQQQETARDSLDRQLSERRRRQTQQQQRVL